ncbi:type IV pilus secretin family protein [candidate division TA06 bacterium]|uniref:Type IV pilus secretin family protein n=2 Tax=candidate division TA06 bacterium TaxID=2250710 RepID=A0A523UN83_UNCT6|nr:MAG: type IV pilus secretin family protein [candidate division TA06 bacterium]
MIKSASKVPLMIPPLLILLFSVALGAGLNDIVVTRSSQGTQVILVCDSPTSFRHYRLAGPSRIVLECAGLQNNIKGQNYSGINRGGVSSISISRFEQADFGRVIIQTALPVDYAVVGSANTVIVTLETGTGVPGFSEWRASRSEAVVYKPPREQVKPATVSPPTTKTVSTKKVAQPQTRRLGKLVSMDLEGADLLTVLRALAEYSGRNMVAGKGVKGTVTVSLRDVPWQQALKIILKATGYAYVEEGGIIRIATPSSLGRERDEREKAAPLVDRVYKIEFAEVREISTVVSRSLSKRGRVESDVRTNSLVVSDIAESQRKVAKLIGILDSPTPQVEIAVKVVEMNYDFSRDLGLQWTTENLTSKKYNITGDLTIGEPIEEGHQVHIATLRNFALLDAKLRIFEKEDKLKTIASPRVVAVNNREAMILEGKKFTIIALDQRGNPITQLYTVGTLLRTTPHINSLDEITLDIHAELSNVSETSVLQRAPIITTSEATTRQLVKDGETVVLGGFIRESESTSESGIPILRSIPLLGNLFKSTSKAVTRREIIFFITPHILRRIE